VGTPAAARSLVGERVVMVMMMMMIDGLQGSARQVTGNVCSPTLTVDVDF